MSEPQAITRLLLDWSRGDELALDQLTHWFTTSCASWPPATCAERSQPYAAADRTGA